MQEAAGAIGDRGEDEIGYAVTSFGDAEALLGEDIDAPLVLVEAEEECKERLQPTVEGFAHNSLLNLAFDVVAVWPVDRAQILFDWDKNWCCQVNGLRFWLE